MFNFENDANREHDRIHAPDCKLCHDTGIYKTHNRTNEYRCYACDAYNKNIDGKEDKEEKG